MLCKTVAHCVKDYMSCHVRYLESLFSKVQFKQKVETPQLLHDVLFVISGGVSRPQTRLACPRARPSSSSGAVSGHAWHRRSSCGVCRIHGHPWELEALRYPHFKRLQGEPTRKPPLHLGMLAVLQNPPGCVLPHSGLIASRLQRPNPELACPAYAQESH